MPRGRLFQADYQPRFSGHETFPLRYGWLKKVYDAVHEAESEAHARELLTRDDAIARFGVGKNMVVSMRHWALTVDVIRETKEGLSPGHLGRFLFGRKGRSGNDPYLENPASLWLLHWHLAANPTKTTWFWAFNHFPHAVFDREQLVRSLIAAATDRGWRRAAASTVKRDVECFTRTYVPKRPVNRALDDEALESPLTELGLIRSTGRREGFRFARSPQPTLGPKMLIYALTSFWNDHTESNTLSLETLVHEPGSPGRVFLLEEEEMAERLANIDEDSGGVYRWSETAGLKQVMRTEAVSVERALYDLADDYRGGSAVEAA